MSVAALLALRLFLAHRHTFKAGVAFIAFIKVVKIPAGVAFIAFIKVVKIPAGVAFIASIKVVKHPNGDQKETLVQETLQRKRGRKRCASLFWCSLSQPLTKGFLDNSSPNPYFPLINYFKGLRPARACSASARARRGSPRCTATCSAPPRPGSTTR